ncbi:cysteine desulfurase [Fodinisporobacter ferrooxydans]|uniref:Cysteine desulfurase n=1 Tax=Fodinisporobacter ferrooxydans TaxID=2901836 RepID=A0ABY4CMQ0_9BACL|nr:cysteine desulfurase [Alicyclobacillaceae bacterium MYW30-H2]
MIYLDTSATTPVLPEIMDIVTRTCLTNFGNPSSLHRLGVQAETIIEDARVTLAKILRAKPQEIIFTGSGTEANNMAVLGSARLYQNRGKHIISTAIEHASVLEALRQLEREGFDVTYVQPDDRGFVSVQDVEDALRPDTILISMMYVNNETGAIQPVQQVGELVKDRPKTLFHVDAIQAFGKLPIDVDRLHADYVSVSGHKIHAPKGIGALYMRRQRKIQPIVWGGGQEQNWRSGTQNVPGIAAIGQAAAMMQEHLAEYTKRMSELRDLLWRKIEQNIPDISIHSPVGAQEIAPHILYVSFPGVRAEVLLHALETDGIYVSTASACSSKEMRHSHVLKAMGKTPEQMNSAIRFSVSPFLQEKDIECTVDRLHYHVQDLRLLMRR